MSKLSDYMMSAACLITLAVISSGFAATDQRCSFKLADCPENFNGTTITVPDYVTTLSSEFYVCKPTSVVEDVTGSSVPPTIMFVIDNTNSMIGSSGSGNDVDGARFRVTFSLLDTIYAKFPKAEIGLVIFRDVLYFDSRDNSNFVDFLTTVPAGYPAYTGSATTQAYLPPLRLDSTVQGGITAINLIKSLLETDSTSQASTVLKYTPQFDPTLSTTGTNINVAFDAAKYGLARSASAPENKFIIFLSDGGGNVDWPRAAEDFVTGTTDIPTTFTVYFSSDGTVPTNIATMTTNIKNNSYSTSNLLSNYYGMEASYDSLFAVLIRNALQPIFTTIKQEPTVLKLNGTTYTEYNVSISSFVLSSPLVLNDDVTHFSMEINYLVRKDSSSLVYDSLVKVDFDVKRVSGSSVPADIVLDCHDTILYNVSVSATDAAAAEKDASLGKVEFTRNNADGELVVYYSISGTADKGIDYVTIPDSVLFLPGISTVATDIIPITDINEEGDETVIIQLLSSKAGKSIRYYTAEPDSALVTIQDIVKEDTISIAVIVNPFTSSKTIIEQLKDANADTKVVEKIVKLIDITTVGTIVSVQTARPLTSVGSSVTGEVTGVDVYGVATIFDALGNVIKKLDLVDLDKDRGNYAAFWDGTNEMHRKVGNGVYLMKIKFTNVDGKTTVESRKVGIKN